MSTVQSRNIVVAGDQSLADWVKRHDLVAYFVLAFALTWLAIAPLLLSQRGLGFILLPEAAQIILYLVATFIGPMPAAMIVTWITEGKTGVKHLLKSMVQWRVGIGWILLPLIGYPVAFLIGLQFVLGSGPLMTLLSNPLILLTSYLPAALFGILFPSLGEEPGWRGFALPRLQRQFGPLAASLILGAMHALWHLPVYFIPGLITEGGFDLIVFIANTLAIIASTFVWTWLFNGGKGSVLFAMFVHGVSNAASGLIGGLLPEGTPRAPFFAFAVMFIAAALVVGLTRGSLGYHPDHSSSQA